MGAITQAVQGRTITPAQSTAITFADEHGDEITITSEDVRQHICPQATPREIVYFMELCRAQKLNPFLNDAYLVKYGGSPAQILVAHKVLLKRADSHPQFDGICSGVIVLRDGTIHKEERTSYYEEIGETLLGGWCEIYRKDRSHPYYKELRLKSMDKHQANWKTMPDVMIVKCAQAAAIREAFPQDFGGMYAREEMGNIQQVESTVEDVPPTTTTSVAQAVADRKPEALTESDMDWLKTESEQLASMGYDLNECKRYLWDIAKSGNMDAARQAAEQMRSKVSQPANVDAETGEVLEAEIELADEDISFGE